MRRGLAGRVIVGPTLLLFLFLFFFPQVSAPAGCWLVGSCSRSVAVQCFRAGRSFPCCRWVRSCSKCGCRLAEESCHWSPTFYHESQPSQLGNLGISEFGEEGPMQVSPLHSALCLAQRVFARQAVASLDSSTANGFILGMDNFDAGWLEGRYLTAVIVWRWRAAPHSALPLVGEKEAWFLQAIYCMAYPGARAKPSRPSTAAFTASLISHGVAGALVLPCLRMLMLLCVSQQPSWPQPPRVASDRTVSVLLGPSMKLEESLPQVPSSPSSRAPRPTHFEVDDLDRLAPPLLGCSHLSLSASFLLESRHLRPLDRRKADRTATDRDRPRQDHDSIRNILPLQFGQRITLAGNVSGFRPRQH